MALGSKETRRWLIVCTVVAAVLSVGAWWSLRQPNTSPLTATARESNNGRQVPAEMVGSSAMVPQSTAKPAVDPSAVIAVPLPPAGAPLAQIYDELKARANAGDAQAASRLYHGLNRCRVADSYRRHISRVLPGLLDADGRLHDVPLEQQDHALQITQEWVAYVERNKDFCAGTSDEQLASIIPTALLAATLGDQKALDCYIGTDFTSMSNLFDHPEVITQYRDNVPGLIDTAIRKGDWVALDLAQRAYSGESEGTPLGQLIAADPLVAYRYQRLERLGASGEFAAELDRQIAQTAGHLTPTQIIAGDSWAQDQYSRYFNSSSSNEVSNGANICQISDD